MERSNEQEKKKCTLRPSQYMKCHIPKTNRLRENKNEFTEKQKKTKLKDTKKHETDVRKKTVPLGKNASGAIKHIASRQVEKSNGRNGRLPTRTHAPHTPTRGRVLFASGLLQWKKKKFWVQRQARGRIDKAQRAAKVTPKYSISEKMHRKIRTPTTFHMWPGEYKLLTLR